MTSTKLLSGYVITIVLGFPESGWRSLTIYTVHHQHPVPLSPLHILPSPFPLPHHKLPSPFFLTIIHHPLIWPLLTSLKPPFIPSSLPTTTALPAAPHNTASLTTPPLLVIPLLSPPQTSSSSPQVPPHPSLCRLFSYAAILSPCHPRSSYLILPPSLHPSPTIASTLLPSLPPQVSEVRVFGAS